MVRIYADIKMTKRRQKKAKPGQQSLPFHGGPREGAGRPRNKTRVSHAPRPVVKSRLPMHITLRLLAALPWLRNYDLMPILKRAFIACLDKDGFRIIQFSIQSNHIHLICEAKDAPALTRGMQGLSIRIARRLNKETGRKGRLFAERYHARILRSPTEVRRVLAYVLNNARRHAGPDISFPRGWIDPLSSAPWFNGWKLPPTPRPEAECPVVAPSTWLLATGWRLRGLIAPDELPGEPPS